MTPINSFKYELGKKESNNNYNAISSAGALGRYQFLPTTLNSLQRIYNLPEWIDKNHFLNSPDLQELYFEKHLANLVNYLYNNKLDRYFGTPVQGSLNYNGLVSEWNESGMLAAMHLAGTGNLSKYFSTGYNPNDGSNSLTDYGYYFSEKFKSPLIANIAGIDLKDSTMWGIAFMLAIVLYYYQQK